jgi:predicted phosphoribosyltransferase
MTAAKPAESWLACSAHTEDRRMWSSSGWLVVGSPSRGRWPRPWALHLMRSSCASWAPPGHEEFAVGALAGDGRVVVNDDVLRALRVTPQQLRDVAEREGRELIRREAAYRDGRPPVDVAGKTVILVDDGLATGASMLAAVQALREAEPANIVIAVPAAPESTCREFAGLVDDIVCASMPTPFLAVGESFWDFTQVSDQEVRQFLSTPKDRYRDIRTPHRADSLRRDQQRRRRRACGCAADGGPGGAGRRRANRVDRRKFAWHTRVLRGARPSPSGSSRRRASAPWPWRPTGPTPTA